MLVRCMRVIAANAGFYSELKPEAIQKLKKLTIISLGSSSQV
jgi:hypothetical protein